MSLYYAILNRRQFILFPYVIDDSVQLLSLNNISKQAPKTAEYFRKNRRRLENRENGRLEGRGWHGYIYLKNMARQALPKVCVPRLVEKLSATLDATGTHFLDNVDVGGLSMRPDYSKHELPYVLGLLNSSLLRWFFPYVSAPFRGGFRSANKQFLSLLPFRLINFSDRDDRARHDQLVKLVEKMLAAKKDWAAADADYEKRRLDQYCADLDKEIDRLVYKLYDLTDDEIAIVENSAPRSS